MTYLSILQAYSNIKSDTETHVTHVFIPFFSTTTPHPLSLKKRAAKLVCQVCQVCQLRLTVQLKVS